jgi:hypothetical protein
MREDLKKCRRRKGAARRKGSKEIIKLSPQQLGRSHSKLTSGTEGLTAPCLEEALELSGLLDLMCSLDMLRKDQEKKC